MNRQTGCVDILLAVPGYQANLIFLSQIVEANQTLNPK
jgi:hypothetical protein